MKKILILLTFNLALSHHTQANDKPLKIVSTFNILHDTVKSLMCCQMTSESLMGEGVDPHVYRAKASDLSRIKSADVVFALGLHLEGRLQETLKQFSQKGARVVFVGETLNSAQLIKDDAHIWFDPKLWIQAGQSISNELIRLRPKHKIELQNKFNIWQNSIEKMIVQAQKQVNSIPPSQRILVTSHDAFQYFGRFFGFEVHAVQGVSTDSEASLKHMDDLRQLIITKKVKAIFVESSVSPISIKRLVTASSTKLGGELFSDSLGPEDSPSGHYGGMILHNIQTLQKALQ